MRILSNRFIALFLVVACLGVVAAAGPATAGKSKKGSFEAQNMPFPHPDGCAAGEEGVHKTSSPLKAPFAGALTVTMEGFEGDWDLFVTDADGGILGEATSSQLTGDAPVEEIILGVKAKQEIVMVACNWLGGPGATVNWELKA